MNKEFFNTEIMLVFCLGGWLFLFSKCPFDFLLNLVN